MERGVRSIWRLAPGAWFLSGEWLNSLGHLSRCRWTLVHIQFSVAAQHVMKGRQWCKQAKRFAHIFVHLFLPVCRKNTVHMETWTSLLQSSLPGPSQHASTAAVQKSHEDHYFENEEEDSPSQGYSVVPGQKP